MGNISFISAPKVLVYGYDTGQGDYNTARDRIPGIVNDPDILNNHLQPYTSSFLVGSITNYTTNAWVILCPSEYKIVNSSFQDVTQGGIYKIKMSYNNGTTETISVRTFAITHGAYNVVFVDQGLENQAIAHIAQEALDTAIHYVKEGAQVITAVAEVVALAA